jgi:hypothetical protein
MEALERPEFIFDELGPLGVPQQHEEEALSLGLALGIGSGQDLDSLPEMRPDGAYGLDVCRRWSISIEGFAKAESQAYLIEISVKIAQEEESSRGPALGIVITRQGQEVRIDGVSGDAADEPLQIVGI